MQKKSNAGRALKHGRGARGTWFSVVVGSLVLMIDGTHRPNHSTDPAPTPTLRTAAIGVAVAEAPPGRVMPDGSSITPRQAVEREHDKLCRTC